MGKDISKLNLFKQYKKYGIPVWQNPQLIFLVMGLIIITSAILTYAIGSKYINDPLVVALFVMILSVVLLIMASIITKSFERLVEANRLKSEFVNIVSHQLRSPLSNLKWVIEILMSGKTFPVSEKSMEYFSILKENNKRMEDLVSALLIVSRIEQNRFPQKKENFFLNEVVKKAIRETEFFIAASNVEVKFDEKETLPEVFADSEQIKLGVENLLDNAIRYTKEKGLIVIKTEKKGRNVYFEIIDNGVGIPKEDRKYIFQKFFRSDNAKRHQTEGSGLGLYIAKSLIEKSGGKIGFRSREGIGSTFWFYLPITKKRT